MLGCLDAEGCARYVVTDVTRDGMLVGPNLAMLEGAIIGTALHTGAFTLEDALAAAAS